MVVLLLCLAWLINSQVCRSLFWLFVQDQLETKSSQQEQRRHLCIDIRHPRRSEKAQDKNGGSDSPSIHCGRPVARSFDGSCWQAEGIWLPSCGCCHPGLPPFIYQGWQKGQRWTSARYVSLFVWDNCVYLQATNACFQCLLMCCWQAEGVD